MKPLIKTGWRDFKTDPPPRLDKVLVMRTEWKHPREAFYDPWGTIILTDCTHPMQNSYCPVDGTKWTND
jgi:hypothetical protein